jgi:hypothetical protein
MEIQRDALSLERVVLRFPGIPYQLGRRERVRSPVKVIFLVSPQQGRTDKRKRKETKQKAQYPKWQLAASVNTSYCLITSDVPTNAKIYAT